MELNVPTLQDVNKLYGMQHKYKETCLFFPSQSQTCHAYCSFCFRWLQFIQMKWSLQCKRASNLYNMFLNILKSLMFCLLVVIHDYESRCFQNMLMLIDKIANLRTIRIAQKHYPIGHTNFWLIDSQEMLDVFEKLR